mgnify:CR=1 FL=1
MDPKKNLVLNGSIYSLALIGTCIAQLKGLHTLESVSYTHLTLPTTDLV